MDTTTELARGTEADHTYLIAVLLTKKGNRTQFPGFLERHLTMFIKRDVLTDHVIDHTLHLTNLLVCHFLEVGEVETQGI